MKRFILSISLSALLFSANGQRKWTLNECIDYAIANNIEIKQQELNVEGSEIQLNTSMNSRLPSLSGSLGQNFNFGRSPSMETGIYEDNASGSTSFSFSTSVPVFSGMRINNEIRSNRLNLNAAMEGLKKAKENLSLNIASYYLDVLFKKEIVGVYAEQVELSRRQEEQTQTKYTAGSIPRSQIFDIQAQVARDELNLTNARNDLAMSLLNLALALNLEDVSGFDIVEPTTVNDISKLNLPSDPLYVYDVAVGNRPHIREAEYRLESSEMNEKVAKASRWPSISFGASYNNGFNFNYSSSSSNRNIGDQLKTNQREAVGLNMSIPIFNRLQTRNQIRSAKLSTNNRILELESAKISLFKEIQQAFQSAVGAQMKYSATEKAFKAAEISYAYMVERYNLNSATVYELTEAQMKLASSRSEQLQAKYEYLFRNKIIDFYLGNRIDIE